MKTSTRKCPECGNTNLICCTSMNIKTCTDWSKHKTKKNITFDWYLDKGQKPIYN